ncbi:hypothetical protein VPH35_084219 [Triticum aestivum]
MEQVFQVVSEKVSSSVVIVRQHPYGRYCVGSVVSPPSNTNTTAIMTSSRLSEESGRIFVHFNDNTELEARRLVSADRFTLLEVDYKAGCSMIEFSKIDVNQPSDAFILAPNSKSCLSHIPAFVVQPSCAARDAKMNNIEGSENYFLVLCRSGNLLNVGYAIQNQLMSAPVFDLNGKVIGLVTSQCGTDKTKNDIKIGLLASHAQVRQISCEIKSLKMISISNMCDMINKHAEDS